MPGLSLVCGTELIEESLDILKYEQNFLIKRFIDDTNIFLVFSGFDGYPVFQNAESNFTIIMEGFIYNMKSEEIKKDLSQIAQKFLQRKSYMDELRQFLLKSDGEFIGLIYFPSLGELLLFNDRLGQLPCYYFQETNKIIVSREIKFILCYVSKIRYERIALAEYLSLRYPLGYRTIFKNILRLEPGHMISYCENKFSILKIVDLSFQIQSEQSQSKKYYVDKTKNLLFTSVKNRLDTLKVYESKVASLSGGYDSRAVFATICQFNRDIIPITLDLITPNYGESEIATRVSEVYGHKIRYLKPKIDITFPVVQDVLYKTDGFINGKTATAGYHYIDVLKSQFEKPPVVNFIGIGGELIRANEPLKHQKRFLKNTVDAVCTDVLSHTLINSSCRCVGIQENELYAFWIELFNSTYKETQIQDKIMHYYWDYTNIYVNEGVDRQRIYVWPVCPFLSSEFLLFAAKEIPRNYLNHEFIEKLLSAIDPRVTVTEIPYWRKRPEKSVVFNFIKNHKFTINLGKKYLRRRWKKKAEKDSWRKLMKEKIVELFESTETIKKYFNKDGVINFCETEYGPDNRFLWQLLSLFLYMNALELKFNFKL